MTSHEILKADVLDILFDNRNKMYGAYVLRRFYHNRLMIALGVTFGIMGLLVLALHLLSQKQQIVENPFKGKIVELIPPPKDPVKPEEPQQPKAASKPMKTEKSLNRIEIVPDKVEADMPTQTELQVATPSDADNIGPEYTGEAQPPASGPLANENHQGKLPVEEQPKNDFKSIERNAEFPGGQEAWRNFLQRHLRTPDELEPGQKKTVLVRFAVGADGSISQFEIVQSGGAAFDKEVIRVLKKMPNWTPAVQNGHYVPVMFTQPVTFMGFEE